MEQALIRLVMTTSLVGTLNQPRVAWGKGNASSRSAVAGEFLRLFDRDRVKAFASQCV